MKIGITAFFILFFSEIQLCCMDPLAISKLDFDPFNPALITFSLIPPYTTLVNPLFMEKTKFKITLNPFNSTATFANFIGPTVAYYNEPSSSHTLYGLIQLPSDKVITTIPHSIKQQVIPFLEEVIRLDYTISFWGPLSEQLFKTNLRFHAWARSWAEDDLSVEFTPATQGIYFNVDVPMGLFEADGVTSDKDGIAFDRLSKQAINIHGQEFTGPIYEANSKLFISPNNAYFLVDKHRDISSFWVVAHSPNKKYLSISYIILINSKEAKNKLESIFNDSTTLGNFINNLKNAVNKFASPDKEALEKIAKNIQAILKGERISSIVEPFVPKFPTELIEAIRKFEYSLQQLINFL